MPEIRYTFVASGQGTVINTFPAIATAAERSSARVRSAALRTKAVQIAAARSTTAVLKAEETKRIAAAIAGNRAIGLADRSAIPARKAAFAAELSAFKLNETKKTAIARSEATKRVAAERRAVAAGGGVGAGVGGGRGRGAGRRRPGFFGRLGGRVLRSAASFGVTAAGFALAGGAAAALRGAVTTDDLVQRLAIRGREPGTEGADPTQLKRDFQRIATRSPGATTQGIAEGVGAFVEVTGDLEAGRRFAKIFADFSIATEASMEDIGKAAAQMFDKFDIKTMDDMGAALATIAVQGKKGSFEVKDFAKFAPKILSAAAAANLKGLNNREGLALVGGLTQVVRGGTGSGAQAATSVEQLFRTFATKSDKIRKTFGIDVFTKDPETGIQQLKDPKFLLASIIKESVGQKEELPKIFGRQAGRALAALSIKFEKTALATGNIDKAFLSLIDQIDNATAAEGAGAEIEKDLALAQQTTSSQLVAAWEQVVQAADKDLLPAFIGLVKELPKLLPAIALVVKFLGFMADQIGAGIEAWDKLFGRFEDQDVRAVRKADEDILRLEAEKAKFAPKIKAGGLEEDDIAQLERIQEELDKANVKKQLAQERIIEKRTPIAPEEQAAALDITEKAVLAAAFGTKEDIAAAVAPGLDPSARPAEAEAGEKAADLLRNPLSALVEALGPGGVKSAVQGIADALEDGIKSITDASATAPVVNPIP